MKLKPMRFLPLTSLFLTGCMFIGAATIPDAKPDRIAKIEIFDLVRNGTQYKYKVILTGKDYGVNVHADPIGALLIGRWHEYPISDTIYLNTIDGEISANGSLSIGDGSKPDIGSISIYNNTMTIDLKWTTHPAGKEKIIPYRFNGKYELKFHFGTKNDRSIKSDKIKPQREKTIITPVVGDTTG